MPGNSGRGRRLGTQTPLTAAQREPLSLGFLEGPGARLWVSSAALPGSPSPLGGSASLSAPFVPGHSACDDLRSAVSPHGAGSFCPQPQPPPRSSGPAAGPRQPPRPDPDRPPTAAPRACPWPWQPVARSSRDTQPGAPWKSRSAATGARRRAVC